MKRIQSNQSERFIRHALWLEYATVGWNVIEAFVAIGAGLVAGSIALVGFGFDSIIEVAAASVLIWRLRCELSCQHDSHEKAEKNALRFIGITFLLLGAYVAYEAGSMLWSREVPSTSTVGLVLAMLSAAIMPFLGLRKRHIAKHIGSKALAADGMETLICAYLSVALLIGLGLNAWLGWWWADPVAALAMLPLILHEGWESLTDDSV